MQNKVLNSTSTTANSASGRAVLLVAAVAQCARSRSRGSAAMVSTEAMDVAHCIVMYM